MFAVARMHLSARRRVKRRPVILLSRGVVNLDDRCRLANLRKNDMLKINSWKWPAIQHSRVNPPLFASEVGDVVQLFLQRSLATAER